MKKLISVFLALALTLSLFSCAEKDREYDEGEVIAAAKELIEKSKLLNYVFWGEGIGYIEDENTANGYYYEADYVSISNLGFRTIDELKELTLAAFSTAFAENVFETTLSSVGDDDGIYSLARYYQKYKDDEMKVPDTIMVYSRAIVLLTDEVEYDYNSIVVEGSKKEIVFITIKATVSRDGKSQERSLRIGLIEEENGWRLNDATYLVYDEQLEEK